MLVILIYQRSIALRDLLKCPHKTKLSEPGMHLATQTRNCGFSPVARCTRHANASKTICCTVTI